MTKENQNKKGEIITHVTTQERDILNLLADYSRTLTLLEQYDKDKLSVLKKGKGKFILNYEEAKKVIVALKNDLVGKKEAGDLFGQEYEGKLQGIISNIYQTFRIFSGQK